MSGYFWTFLALLAISDYFWLIRLISVSLQWQRGGGLSGQGGGRLSQLLIYCSFTIIDLKRSIDLKWLFQCYYSSLDDHVTFSFILFKAEKCDNIKSVFLYSGFKAVWKVWWNWEGMMKDNSLFCKSAFNHEMRKLLCWGRMRMCTLARSVWGQNTKWFVGIFDVLWYFPVHFFGYIVRTTSAWFQIIWDFVWIISKKKKNVCFECEAALSFYFVFKIFDLFGWFREFGPSLHDLVQLAVSGQSSLRMLNLNQLFKEPTYS